MSDLLTDEEEAFKSTFNRLARRLNVVHTHGSWNYEVIERHNVTINWSEGELKFISLDL